MSEIDAIGDAVTGSMLARAVEPDTGLVRKDGRTQETNCLNCGVALEGPYCHACGQKAHIRRSLRGFAQDAISGALNIEGKIWRTLPLLAWRPGELTRRYIAGERARFVSPIALYLFTVFVMFAVLNFSGALGTGAKPPIHVGFEQAAIEQKAEIARLEKQRAKALAAGKSVKALDIKIAKDKEDLASIEKLRQGKLPVEADVGNETPQWVRSTVEKVQKNPELVTNNVQEAASKFSWLLIPLSVPFLWLLFPFSRRYHLYDHTVFVTYSLSFMMMLVIIAGVLVEFNSAGLAGLLFLVPPFHMYRQLKGAYQLSRFGTWWRTIMLVTFAIIAGALFFVIVAALGVGVGA